MDTSRSLSVEAALKALLDALEAEIAAANGHGAAAFQRGDHAEARRALQISEWLSGFQAKVLSFVDEWERRPKDQPTLPLHSAAEASVREPVRRRSYGQAQRGARTPQTAYVIPILKALAELGGRGRTADVLTRVGHMMEQRFTSLDLAPLPSNTQVLRWWNTAQWARNEMVNNGLLRNDSPRGIWEITEKGRRYLEQHSRDSIA